MKGFLLRYSAPSELQKDCCLLPPAGAGGYSYLALSEPKWIAY